MKIKTGDFFQSAEGQVIKVIMTCRRWVQYWFIDGPMSGRKGVASCGEIEQDFTPIKRKIIAKRRKRTRFFRKERGFQQSRQRRLAS